MTQFEDDNLYIQFYPFVAADETIPIKCLDTHFQLKTSAHISEYRGQTLLRAKMGRIGVKTSKKLSCLLFIRSTRQIVEVDVRRLLGFPNSSALPDTISWSPVQEIDTSLPNEHYDYTTEPLVVIDRYEKIYESYDFRQLDPRLRAENERLKRSQGGTKIFLTLTTSPSRLKLLHYTLRSMDLDLVDIIFVTLPKLFKDSERYTIPIELQTEFPKLTFLSEERDFGPICKIVSAVQFVQETFDPEVASSAIFISIDDDNMYSDRLVDTLAYHSFVNEGSVITAASFELFPFVSFGVLEPSKVTINGSHLKLVASLEGFAGVAYRGWQVDWKLMKFLADKRTRTAHLPCYFSDDIVIYEVLLLRNVPVLRLPTEDSVNFYSRNERRDLPHYADANSLQLTDENGKRDSVYMHIKRYQLCHAQLLSYFVDFDQENLVFKEIPRY